MKIAKYFLAAILLVSAVVLTMCGDSDSWTVPDQSDGDDATDQVIFSRTYTEDTDGDMLPDGIEQRETDPRSWRTDNILDLKRISTGNRQSSDLFNRAYDRYKRGLDYAVQRSCAPGGAELLDTNSNGHIDIEDDLMGPDGVLCEDDASGSLNIRGVHSGDVPRYLPDEIIITSTQTGDEFGCATIECHLTFASYLAFARFCQESVSYGRDAVISGEFYSGDNVLANNKWVIFQRNVTVGGKLVNPGNVIFEPGVVLTEDYPIELSIDIGNQVDNFEDEAKIRGWFIDSSNGKQCLDDSQDGGTDNLLVLTNFKGLNTDTPVYDNGTDCTGENSWKLYDPADPSKKFNGVVFWDDANTGSIHVKGTLGADNLGISTSVFSRSSIYIDSSIYTGYSGDPVVDGHPVNVGLIADGDGAQIRISNRAPNFLRVNAAIMSAQANWYGGGGTKNGKNSANPPDIPDGPYDLDGNGVLESLNMWYINETSYNAKDVVVLWFLGPIITKPGPAGPPSGGAGYYLHGYREYSYDTDILAFPPPFPQIPNMMRLRSCTRSVNALR